jgi:WD40 repeat protein
MSRYTLFLAAAGALCPGGPSPASAADIKPLRAFDPGCGVWELAVSTDGKQAVCFNGSTLTRIDLVAGQAGKEPPVPLKLRGEKIYSGIHVEGDTWLLALDRPKFLTDADRYSTRFVLFDFATETVKADWPAHKDTAAALAVAPRQGWLITAGTALKDRTVCFWDRKTLKKVAEFDICKELNLKDEPDRAITTEGMVIDPTSSFLAFGMRGGTFLVWDLDKGQWHSALPRREGPVLRSLRFLDSRSLAIVLMPGINKQLLEVYDWRTGKILLRVGPKSELSEPAVTANGRLMAVAESGWRGTQVRLWDLRTWREVGAFKTYDGGTQKMAFSGDGKRLVTSGRDCMLKVWDVEKIVRPPKP